MDDKTLSAIFLGILAKLIPGTLGSLSSLLFAGGDLGWKQKATSFFAGIAIAWFIAPLVIGLFGIKWNGAPESIGFVIGLFGVAFAREVFKEINDADFIGAIKRRFLGSR